MPYHVGKTGRCSASKPFGVTRDDGTVVPGGCHATYSKALAHQRALMVNVPDAQDKTKAPPTGARAIEEDIAVPDIMSDPSVNADPRLKLQNVVAKARVNASLTDGDEDSPLSTNVSGPGYADQPTTTCPHCGNTVIAWPESCPVCNRDLTNYQDRDGEIVRPDGADADEDSDDSGSPTANQDPTAEVNSRDMETPPGYGRNVVTATGSHVFVTDPSYAARKFTQAKRQQLAKDGKAMPDGSFPIEEPEDVTNAVNLARTPAQRAHVKRQAKRLGATNKIPDNWS